MIVPSPKVRVALVAAAALPLLAFVAAPAANAGRDAPKMADGGTGPRSGILPAAKQTIDNAIKVDLDEQAIPA